MQLEKVRTQAAVVRAQSQKWRIRLVEYDDASVEWNETMSWLAECLSCGTTELTYHKPLRAVTSTTTQHLHRRPQGVLWHRRLGGPLCHRSGLVSSPSREAVKKQNHIGTAMQQVADQQPIAHMVECAAAGGADRDSYQRSPQASVTSF